MQLIQAFNPTDTARYPNANGVIQVGAADAGSKMLLYNESQLNLVLDFYNGNQGMLHAWEARYWSLDGDTKQVGWSIESVLNQPDPPISSVKGELYGPQEKVEGTYPISLVRQTSTAGTVNTVTSSSTFTSVKDAAYGAIGDGITDDTIAIANARAAVNAAGGGIVFYPKGTYITGNLIDYDNLTDMGSGQGATTLKLKAGSNTDLFGSRFTANININAAAGASSSSASHDWHIRDLTLDGNNANQSSGPSYCIRAYAYGYNLSHVKVINGFSGGILVDYNGAFPSSSGRLEFMWQDLDVLFNWGVGVEIGGPTDGQWVNGISAFNDTHNIHLCPNGSWLLTENVHGYNAGNRGAVGVSWLVEGALTASNCEAEGSNTVQLAIITDHVVEWNGGYVAASAHTGAGVQIGQVAGLTPYANSVWQSGGLTTLRSAPLYSFNGTYFAGLTNSGNGVHGSIWFVNDGGGSIAGIAYRPAGSAPFYTGTPSTRTTFGVTQFGITPNGTFVNDGGIVTTGPIASNLTSIDIAGDTSGFARCYEDLQGTVKRVYITLDNYKHVGASQPQFILPVPFIKGGLIRAGNTNTQVACWQGVTARNINVVTSFVGTATVQGNIGPYQWGDITDTFDRVLLPALMGSTVANGVIIIEGH